MVSRRAPLLALAVLLVFQLACGGSSSETPPPVEPAVERLRMDEEATAEDKESADAGAQKLPESSKPE